MTRMVLAFAGGVIVAALWLAGVGVETWAALAMALAAFAWRSDGVRIALCFVLGAGHFEIAMQRYLDQRDALLAKPMPMAVAATVEDLPDCDERGCVLQLRLPDRAARVRVFWNSPGRELHPGQRLRLTLALHPHWSLRNPGTFDRETWALSRGIHATGRVLSEQSSGQSPDRGSGLDGLRARLGAMLAERLHGVAAAPLLAALALGDRRGLDERHWAVLQPTGTAHLLAISGLHIGLVAGLALFAVRWGYWLLPAGWVTRQRLAAAVAIGAALGYAALAGFSLPTVRALVMLAVPVGALLVRRGVVASQGLTAALGAVLLIDPLAPLQAGLWLSFGAVGILLWVSRGYLRPPRDASGGRWRSVTARIVRPQWAICLGMAPLLAAVGLPVSLLAPLLNLIAIPWVSLAVLPPLLAGIAALLIWPPLAEPLLRASGAALQVLWRGLELAAGLPGIQLHLAAPDLALGLALLATLCLLAPRGWPGRLTALLLLGPLLAPPSDRPPSGTAFVHVLDVGQGAAIVVQTRKHVLVYDSGPGWGRHWNAGAAVVRPFLLRQGITRVDRVVVSHTDMDHAGGLPGLQPLLKSTPVIGSSADGRWPRCQTGDSWHWNGVGFEVLHPSRWLPYLGNDSSCVLQVAAGEGRFLLTGDIGEAVERRLASVLHPVGGMSVPHHGSRYSSSAAFLGALQPRLAVVSVGQGNRFDMPHPQIAGRYRARAIVLLSTAECGYLKIQVGPRPDPRLMVAERARSGRPWQQPGLCPAAQTKA